jgi:cytochrome c-type biogenesis protein CcmE
MTRKQQRIYAVVVVLLGVAVATGLTLTALRQNVTFFYSPSEIAGTDAPFVAPARAFRLGGLVKTGSVRKQGLQMRFTVTDNRADIDVIYEGVVPNLFAENKGVVATGKLNEDGVFIAQQLLAKHDENYMPPEVARALKKAE